MSRAWRMVRVSSSEILRRDTGGKSQQRRPGLPRTGEPPASRRVYAVQGGCGRGRAIQGAWGWQPRGSGGLDQNSCLERREMVWPGATPGYSYFRMLCLRGNRKKTVRRCGARWAGSSLAFPSPLLFYPHPPFLSPSLSSLSPFLHPSIHPFVLLLFLRTGPKHLWGTSLSPLVQGLGPSLDLGSLGNAAQS